MLVGGTKQFGKIARVPGVLHVSTQFVHFCFLPLFPTGSFVVQAGTEASDGFFGGTFRGKSIPLHLGSVIAAYARWWFGIPMVVMAVANWIAVNEFLIAAKADRLLGTLGFVGSLALLVPLSLSMVIPGKRGYWFQAIVHLVSATAGVVYWVMVGQQPDLADFHPAVNTPVPPLLVVNVCLFVCGLFRLLDYANSDDAREFAQELGIDITVADSGEVWYMVE